MYRVEAAGMKGGETLSPQCNLGPFAKPRHMFTRTASRMHRGVPVTEEIKEMGAEVIDV